MANQKQRRRRAKEKRHEYDLVEIDAEGNETVLSASELKEAEPKKAKDAPKKQSRRGRAPEPPSWRRVAKRGALFGPVFFAVVYILGGGKVTILGALLNTFFLMVVFIPFSYFMDHMVWRSYVKRNPSAAKR